MSRLLLAVFPVVAPLGLFASTAYLPAAPAQPRIFARTLNLKGYGVVAYGTTINTEVFARALAAVKAAGPAKPNP